MRMVRVTWEDSNSSGGWQSEPKDLRPVIARSVGFVYREDDAGIILVSGVLDDEFRKDDGQKSYDDCLAIPRSAIRVVEELDVVGGAGYGRPMEAFKATLGGVT